MTSTPKPIKLEITDLEDVQKEVQILKNRINGYRIKTVELQNQIKELDKLWKEDEEKLKKIEGEEETKKEKVNAIKKMLEETTTDMDGLETDLDNAINLIEIPPKKS